LKGLQGTDHLLYTRHLLANATVLDTINRMSVPYKLA
jgi:hypothetical protein